MVDGGTVGRDGDDLRIEHDEWMAGYKGVTGFGFVALKDIASDEAAEV